MAPSGHAVPIALIKQIKEKANKHFFRALYSLPPDASKRDRQAVLNSGNKKKRTLVIKILHQILKGAISLARKHQSDIEKTENLAYLRFLNREFQSIERVRQLIKASDIDQKTVLAQVTNFHVLFYPFFNR